MATKWLVDSFPQTRSFELAETDQIFEFLLTGGRFDQVFERLIIPSAESQHISLVDTTDFSQHSFPVVQLCLVLVLISSCGIALHDAV